MKIQSIAIPISLHAMAKEEEAGVGPISVYN